MELFIRKKHQTLQLQQNTKTCIKFSETSHSALLKKIQITCIHFNFHSVALYYVESMSRSCSRVSANVMNHGLSLGLDDQHEVTISIYRTHNTGKKYIATLCNLTNVLYFSWMHGGFKSFQLIRFNRRGRKRDDKGDGKGAI